MMQKSGFTLVELSIVLVIIGLLIGGILGGQELIRASELNSLVSDVNKYKVAVNAFKLKYNALPGDMTNATAYWGTASGGCPNGIGTGTQTCNGNGDGQLTIATTNEPFRVWQHLANAGIIPGTYTGVTGGGGAYDCDLGLNCPAGKPTGSVFGLSYIGVTNGNWAWYDSTWGHAFVLGNNTGWPGWQGTMLSAADAMAMDTKNDDGRPTYGNFMGMQSMYWGTTCTTTDTSAAQWAVSSATATCGMIIKSGF